MTSWLPFRLFSRLREQAGAQDVAEPIEQHKSDLSRLQVCTKSKHSLADLSVLTGRYRALECITTRATVRTSACRGAADVQLFKSA